MDMCGKKNSQLSEEHWIYKGSVVFRGDCIKDEQGFHAVFSEQGTSASHMAAAKLIDALSRCDGMDGQDAEAVGAYTQATLKDMADKMGEELVDTWITLPKHKQPASWAGIDNPVCLLARNLYGHPRAGLYWEKFQRKAHVRCRLRASRRF